MSIAPNKLLTLTMPYYCWQILTNLLDHQLQESDYEDAELEDVLNRIDGGLEG